MAGHVLRLLEGLDTELHYYLMGQLDPPSLAAFTLACRELWSLNTSPAGGVIWRKHCVALLGKPSCLLHAAARQEELPGEPPADAVGHRFWGRLCHDAAVGPLHLRFSQHCRKALASGISGEDFRPGGMPAEESAVVSKHFSRNIKTNVLSAVISTELTEGLWSWIL
jgi:hypothetical protein